MKMLIAALMIVGSVQASAELVTETVCRATGDSGTETCVKITYNKLPASAPVPVKCSFMTDAGEVPCPTTYGVPAIINSLNKFFLNHGFVPNDSNDYSDHN